MSPAKTYPTPHGVHLPISHDLTPWKIDDALNKVATIQGKDGTVGFLPMNKAAPGYASFFKSRSNGFQWHIATIMIARREVPT